MDSSNPSRSHPPYRPRDYISIFVHALHLLDLDLLPDFPPTLTQLTLRSTPKAPSNLQQRVKCVEWALFRLFEIYDPVETREKLRPHFPPSTPKDSLNLRAALYRSLTELKKNAVLPRETVLRRTMLDECKGEKFEELLASFGMLVLRKKVDDLHLAGIGNTTQKLQNVGTEQIVPILLAHRISLQNSLQRRQSLQKRAATQMDEIRQLRKDIDTRTQSLSQNTLPDELNEEEYEGLKDCLNHAFAMDRRWVTFLLEGSTAPTLGLSNTDTSQHPTPATEKTNTAHYTNTINETSEHDKSSTNEPMTQLLASVDERRLHVEQLKLLRDTIRPSSPVETRSPRQFTAVMAKAEHDAASSSVNNDKTMRFGRHQSLKLGAWAA
ncbi:hypothetical protein RBB50_006566 [Rhinocladiella similis]